MRSEEKGELKNISRKVKSNQPALPGEIIVPCTAELVVKFANPNAAAGPVTTVELFRFYDWLISLFHYFTHRPAWIHNGSRRRIVCLSKFRPRGRGFGHKFGQKYRFRQ